MQRLNRNDFTGANYPNKIIQFGEGNFLRAFVDWQVDLLNQYTDLNAGIMLVRPIDSDFPPSLNTQDGLYTTVIRGVDANNNTISQQRLIRSVNGELNCYQQFDQVLELARDANIRFLFSNTTEAGIAYHSGDKITDMPPVSYPAKLTRLLFERFTHFNGAEDKGWVLFPCELIDYNGEALKELVLRYATEWQLPSTFQQWVEQSNTFCSTLVDRIVTGFPHQEHETLQQECGYLDQFMVTAEHFYLFVIQGPAWLEKELCLDKLPTEHALNIRIVDDIKPYKERKVAILNGAHTSLVPVAYLADLNTVGESMNDPQIAQFIDHAIFNEIVPTLDLAEDELKSFAADVQARFRNPFIQHQLLSIALNGMTKFRTRILPQILNYQQQQGKLPSHLTFAFAALLAFYRGKRGEQSYELQDDKPWLDTYAKLWPLVENGQLEQRELIKQVLSNSEHWGQSLVTVPQLVDTLDHYLNEIRQHGMRTALSHCC